MSKLLPIFHVLSRVVPRKPDVVESLIEARRYKPATEGQRQKALENIEKTMALGENTEDARDTRSRLMERAFAAGASIEDVGKATIKGVRSWKSAERK